MSWISDLLGYKIAIDTSTGSDVEKPQRSKIRFLGASVADNPSLSTTDVQIGGATENLKALSLTLGPGTSQSATGLLRVAHGQEVLKGKDSGSVDRTLISWGSDVPDTVRFGSANVIAELSSKSGLSLMVTESSTEYRLVQLVFGLTANQRVLALCRQPAVTATQLPAGVGDRVVYLADANANPTVNAVGGHIYYSDGGRPGWRFVGTTLRLDGTAGTATAGAGAAPPATVQGYITAQIDGTLRKIPFYAN